VIVSGMRVALSPDMRLHATLLAILISACTHDSGDQPVQGTADAGGGVDTGGSATGQACIYLSVTYTTCTGSGTTRDESTKCKVLTTFDTDCPGPLPDEHVIGDCLVSTAYADEQVVAGDDCDAVLARLEAERCARLGEGMCHPEDCQDGKDNDGNGLGDCEEESCRLVDGACLRPENRYGLCMGFFDEDGDHVSDCRDPDCETLCAENEGLDPDTCTDGVDNDNDGIVDCDEEACHDPRHFEIPCPGPVEICDNNADDDGDLRVDCSDDDCAERCNTEEGLDARTCQDGIDNDHDGLVDCQEPACLRNSSALACARPERGTVACSDGYDNDRDGLIDGEDDECL